MFLASLLTKENSPLNEEGFLGGLPPDMLCRVTLERIADIEISVDRTTGRYM
jgi:hypothetical protein